MPEKFGSHAEIPAKSDTMLSNVKILVDFGKSPTLETTWLKDFGCMRFRNLCVLALTQGVRIEADRIQELTLFLKNNQSN